MNAVDAAGGPPAQWLRRSPRARWVLAGTAVAGGIAVLILTRPARPEPSLPVGSSSDTPQEKKAAFINYLVPQVREVNARILRDRRRLTAILQDVAAGDQPGYFDGRWLKKLVADYGAELPERITTSFLDQMLVRVDVVPPSLVIAQAAVESGWGTSRFAQRGNNLFGLRAYGGKGLTPKARDAGEKFKVAAYPSVHESVAEYINNLNTGESYIDLRMTRRELRQRGQPVTGTALVSGLAGYSGRGADYVETILAVITANKLGRFDS